MSDPRQLPEEQVEAITELAELRLPPERLATLTSNLAQFLADFARVQAIEVGDREPPVLTYAAEYRETRR